MKKRRTKPGLRARLVIIDRQFRGKVLKQSDFNITHRVKYDSHVGLWARARQLEETVITVRAASAQEPAGTVCTTLPWKTTWRLTDGIRERIYYEDLEFRIKGNWVDDEYERKDRDDLHSTFRRMGRHLDEVKDCRGILSIMREELDAPEIVGITAHYDDDFSYFNAKCPYDDYLHVKFAFNSDHDAVMFALKWQ